MEEFLFSAIGTENMADGRTHSYSGKAVASSLNYSKDIRILLLLATQVIFCVPGRHKYLRRAYYKVQGVHQGYQHW